MKTLITLIAAGCFVGIALAPPMAPSSLASSEKPQESEQTTTMFGTLLLAGTAAAQTTSPRPATYPALPSDTPAKFEPATDSFDYVSRDVMIPMRDGVKLHTVILIPKGGQHAPILLTRTPYNANELTRHVQSAHLGSILQGYDNATEVIVEGGYIRVVQDVRGKYGSEGDYVMNRPLHGPQNPTPVDHSTDTYDTIDWLVKTSRKAMAMWASSEFPMTAFCR